MKIKKHKNKNEYYLTESGMWVRNYTKPSMPFIDINETVKETDYLTFLNNEYNNAKNKFPWIDSQNIMAKKVIIVSDGFNFAESHKVLDALPKDVVILGTHNALNKWQIKRPINYYVVNNPYEECLNYLPKNNFPKCIASNRTNNSFLNNYKGVKYRYYPVNEQSYNGMNCREVQYQVDDNRNAICASIALSYYFGVEKLMLFCCDDTFGSQREGAEKVGDVWMYPHQRTAHDLVDGYCFWMKKTGKTLISNHSSGLEYNYAQYIKIDKINDFFNGVI